MFIFSESRLEQVEAARIMRELDPKECCLYVMFAKDGEGPMYIKVGISEFPGKRARHVQTGCPIPIRRVIAFRCSSRRTARSAEVAMHEAMKEHSVTGEWFRLEWGQEAKDSLHALIEKVMDAIGGVDLKDVTDEDTRVAVRKKQETWESAQKKAKVAAYNKYRLTVELRAPLRVA